MLQVLVTVWLLCLLVGDAYHQAPLVRTHTRILIRGRRSYLNEKSHISQVEDDGYSQSNPSKLRRVKNFVKRALHGQVQPGTLILVRHGESQWNYNKLFTGWVDVDLSERGRREVEHAARLLLEQGYTVDVAYTSRLKRAIRSTWIILRELNQIFRPVYKSYRLNERMYGALEGLSKPQMALELGVDFVQSWRSGLLARPPPMSPEHPHWHAFERKYADLTPEEIPITESLQDTMNRTLPLWESRILPALQAGRNVMIVAHGNSLRGIVKHIDSLSQDEIQNVGIPNGIPLVYKFNKKMEPVPQPMAVSPLSGEFLEKKGLLRAALEREAELAKNVPGYEIPPKDALFVQQPPTNSDPYIRGLSRLSQERLLLEMVENTGQTPPTVAEVSRLNSEERGEGREERKKTLSEEFSLNVGPLKTDFIAPTGPSSSPVPMVPSTERKPVKSSLVGGDYLVIIRHGKTEHNKLGLFTGWEDAPLALEGRNEAREAGRVLRMHGIEFDVVYTSWLSRAIETGWLVLNELDSLWLPIHKTWRLNERMYGALTGLSKKMIGQRHGQSQLKLWRRSYATRPPRTSSFAASYPGNDDRYCKYVKDIRYSVFESVIRSLAHGKVELHRKFPYTESLQDCMERTIPYLTNVIMPDSVSKGRKVLIASSENAIRGLLMHLLDIPTDVIHQVEIPTGLPLVFDLNSRCLKLLDDGTEDLLSRYDFGAAPELLFRPCNAEVETDSDTCFIGDDGRMYVTDPIIRLPQRTKKIERPYFVR